YKMDDSWCYENRTRRCDKYGRLYSWEAAMNACPQGWHLPSDAEWKILEGTVDSQYGVGDPEWDDTVGRSLDAGKKLKFTSGWYNGGNGTDDYGFSALPGGYRLYNGSFDNMGHYAYFWSSTETAALRAWYRILHSDTDAVGRYDYNEDYGFSVRCLRDL
ncbi:MAG: FISUMP domain-containing protein, partial [Bacteroidales bacterium]